MGKDISEMGESERAAYYQARKDDLDAWGDGEWYPPPDFPVREEAIATIVHEDGKPVILTRRG